MAGSFRPNWVPYPPPPHRHHPGFHPIRRFSNVFIEFHIEYLDL